MAKQGELVIDLSKHNETVDFQKMKDAGCRAVILRAGYRSAKQGVITTDPKLAENTRKAVKAGLPLGLYWWTSAVSEKEAVAEANALVNLAQSRSLSFPLWLDLEYFRSDRSGRSDHLSAKQRTDCALAFTKRCSKLGYDCGIYCNPDFWKSALEPERLDTLPRWIAHYDAGSAGLPCDLWQYSSTGKGSKYGTGSKYVDLNRMYTDFPAGQPSQFASGNAQSPTGNPYPEPTKLVTSEAQAKAKGIRNYLSSGDAVRWFQYELKRLGYDLGPSGIDGICGPKTAAAIGAFQKDAGLTVDELGGPKTRAALKAAAQRPAAPEASGPWRSKLAKAAKVVYDTVVELGCRHKSGADTLAEIRAKKITTCSSSVTASLKEAGLMQKGKLGHRKKDGHGGKTKTTAEQVFYGLEYLDRDKIAEITMVNRLYKDLPERYRKPGIVYGQDSNICISAPDASIYSTNEGKIQMKGGKYVRDRVKSGYPFTSKILAVIVPKE